MCLRTEETLVCRKRLVSNLLNVKIIIYTCNDTAVCTHRDIAVCTSNRTSDMLPGRQDSSRSEVRSEARVLELISGKEGLL